MICVADAYVWLKAHRFALDSHNTVAHSTGARACTLGEGASAQWRGFPLHSREQQEFWFHGEVLQLSRAAAVLQEWHPVSTTADLGTTLVVQKNIHVLPKAHVFTNMQVLRLNAGPFVDGHKKATSKCNSWGGRRHYPGMGHKQPSLPFTGSRLGLMHLETDIFVNFSMKLVGNTGPQIPPQKCRSSASSALAARGQQ